MASANQIKVNLFKDSFFHHYVNKIDSYLQSDTLGIKKSVEEVLKPCVDDISAVLDKHAMPHTNSRHILNIGEISIPIELPFYPIYSALNVSLNTKLAELVPDKMEALDNFVRARRIANNIRARYLSNYTELIYNCPFIERFIVPPIQMKVKNSDKFNGFLSKEEQNRVETILHFMIINCNFNYKIPGDLNHYKAEKD